jgi:putative PIN family toxin of toxin-antitoxin system
VIRAVLDTNVLVSGFSWRDSPPGRAVAAWRTERYTLLVSAAILTELAATLNERYFSQHLSADERARWVALVTQTAERVTLPDTVPRIASHRQDDPILATAVAGRADYLVTGDHELRALGTYEGVRIVSPVEFLALLDAA